MDGGKKSLGKGKGKNVKGRKALKNLWGKRGRALSLEFGGG